VRCTSVSNVLNILGSSRWKWKVDFILSLFNEFSPQCGLFTDRRQKYFTVVYCNIYLLMICRCRVSNCGDAFPIEGVLVATYLLSVEALPHCRCGVANKNRIV